jgi:MFS family permease
MHGLSNGVLGAILCGVVFGAALVIPVVSYLSEHYGSAMATRAGSCIVLMVFPIIGIDSSLWILILAMVGLGFSVGFQDISMNGQAVVQEKILKKPSLGLFTSLFAIGNLFGALMGGIIIGPLDRSVLEDMAFMSLCLVIPNFLFSFNLYSFEEEKQANESEKLISKTELADDTEENRGLLERATENSESGTLIDPQETDPDTRSLVIVSIICFISYFGEGSVGDWSAIYLHNHGANSLQSTFGFVSFQLFLAIGRLYSDYIVLHVGRKKLLNVAGLLSSCGLFIVAITPFIFEDFNSFLFISILGFSICGIGMSAVYPTVISYAGNGIRGIKPVDAIGTVASVGYIGVMIGPPLIGGLSMVLGLQVAFAIDGIIIALISAISLFLK